jgi:V/A-type H+-transporting ATPase subunit I
MLAAMTKVRIFGRKPQLEPVLRRLYELRLLQLESAAEADVPALAASRDRADRAEELRLLLVRLDGLLALGDGEAEDDGRAGAAGHADVGRELDGLTPQIEALHDRVAELSNELAVLPRYLEPLEALLPLVPELAELDEAHLRALQLDTIALVLNTEDDALLATLREVLVELLGDRFELVAKRVDRDAVGCVIVVPHRDGEAVRALLGREQVRHLPLPARYERLSFQGAVAAMERRLGELPSELAEARRALRELVGPPGARWRRARRELAAELEQLEAAAKLGETARTFVVVGWTPRGKLPFLRDELERAANGQLVLEELPATGEAPVLMANRKLAQPFEFLVRLLDLPRHGTLDPTMLMALFLPLMVGVMIGDVVYGALLLVLAVVVRRRVGGHSAAVRDLSRVFVAGAVWAIVFGFLFGEALGDIGAKLGLPALWVYRGGADGVEPLLLFSLALGAAHVVLGLALGLWQSLRARRVGELLERAGSLLALCSVFVLAAIVADRLPATALTPAAAGVAVGLVLLVVPGGVLGLMMGPLAFVGTLGNVLSYLRIGAVGLASAYLALVANQLATLGPLWLGVLVAALFHALNLALAAFSPMIQALRLHYVEFFSKFYDGGGKPFRPFGDRAGA